jgi:benzoylsuccinyl-CoA thiolase BbsB subunit
MLEGRERKAALRDVLVVGTGLVPFARTPEKTLADIAWPAVLGALREAGIEPEAIEAAYCGTALGGMLAGQRVLKPLGMVGIPVVNTENACASSATAFREAWVAIGAGLYDVALVLGVEKLTKLGGGSLPLEQDDWEAAHGMSMPALYAMRAQRYMHDHGVSAAQLGAVSVKAHRHGVLNPDAQRQKEFTLDEVMRSRPVADPLTVLQCCPVGDGAAAVVLASAAAARRHGCTGARVAGSTLVSGRLMTGFRDFTLPEITVRAARQVYEGAGIGPDEIDVAEVHDAFTIAELLYYEALGLCARGEGAALLESGASSLGGRIPVNPSGGLLAKGHPVGATGVAQIVEIARQLRGCCGARQVEGAKVGLAHVTGGGVSGLDHGACAIHIFAR